MRRLHLPDGSTWPRPAMESDEAHGPAWMLTHAPECMTRAEQVLAASIIEAYGALIELPLTDSRRKLSMIRRALRDERGTTDG